MFFEFKVIRAGNIERLSCMSSTSAEIETPWHGADGSFLTTGFLRNFRRIGKDEKLLLVIIKAVR